MTFEDKRNTPEPWLVGSEPQAWQVGARGSIFSALLAVTAVAGSCSSWANAKTDGSAGEIDVGGAVAIAHAVDVLRMCISSTGPVYIPGFGRVVYSP